MARTGSYPSKPAGGSAWRRRLLAGAAFALSLALCAYPAPAAAPGAKLLVQPEQLELSGASGEHGLLLTLVEPDGRTVDVTSRGKFTTSDPAIVAVAGGPLCRAAGDGSAQIDAEYEGLHVSASVHVVEAGKSAPLSFRQDVIPVMTKAGCNAGSCHGKLAGQNGFRLSLRGYAPEIDYDSLTTELGSRRIDFAEPDKSLLLLKPLGLVPHEGGRRFDEGSRPAAVLLDWIKNRAPGPDAKEPDASSLDVLPGNRTLRPGDEQQILVIAHWPDGRQRDVTWLCQFYANDPSAVSVSESGKVKSLRSGETSVRVHFQGLVGVITFTTPFDYSVDPGQFTEKNNVLDEQVFARLQSLHIRPSPPCDDATFIRRAFIDTIGVLPTPAEVRAFLADSSPSKRPRLIDGLLERPEFADYWALQFCDLLQNRRERDHDARGAKGTRAMHEWLRQQMLRNRPWNELATDVLTAAGDIVHTPQVGYFFVVMSEGGRVEESDVTDSVAQAFLGTRMGCARCHNHPMERYTQDDYYHFTAFFARTALRRTENGKGVPMLLGWSHDEDNVVRQLDEVGKQIFDAEGKAIGAKGEDEKKVQAELASLLQREQDLCSQRQSARERPPTVNQPRTGREMAPQPLDRSMPAIAPGEDARQALAAWITDPKNAYFSGAMVNRLWKHFLGVGLVEPVDDLRASNPPSNPALMKALSAEFVGHGYDLKHVMRLILNSRTYQLSSETLPENEKDHHFFSHYYARRLESEVMADAVSAATGVPATYPGYPLGLRATQLPEPAVTSYFLSLFGRSERTTACACERSGEVTLPQLLHLNNGDDVLDRIGSGDGRLAKILADNKDDPQATEEIFLDAFGRLPVDNERMAVEKALAGGSRDEVYRDLMWALLNSTEFAFNH